MPHQTLKKEDTKLFFQFLKIKDLPLRVPPMIFKNIPKCTQCIHFLIQYMMSTTKTISEKKLKKQLQKVLAENPNTIKAFVIQEAFEYHNIKDFFKDLLHHGCVSGMVSSLCFYNQTETFFDYHYHEIMELKEDFEESTGVSMQIPYQLKNHLAWFGLEQTAYQLVNEIGLEI